MPSNTSPPRTRSGGGGSRLTGVLLAIVGSTSTVLAMAVGTAAIAQTEGVRQGFWVVLSVATLSGQATAGLDSHQVTMMVLSVWMVINYLTLGVAVLVLWQTCSPPAR